MVINISMTIAAAPAPVVVLLMVMMTMMTRAMVAAAARIAGWWVCHRPMEIGDMGREESTPPSTTKPQSHVG